MKRFLSLLVLVVLIVSCQANPSTLDTLDKKAKEITSFHHDTQLKMAASQNAIQTITITSDYMVENKDFKEYHHIIEQPNQESEVYYNGKDVHLFTDSWQTLPARDEDYDSTYFNLIENIRKTYDHLEEEVLEDGTTKLSFRGQNQELYDLARAPFKIELGNVEPSNIYINLNYEISPEGYLVKFNQLFEGSMKDQIYNFFITNDFSNFNNVEPITPPEGIE